MSWHSQDADGEAIARMLGRPGYGDFRLPLEALGALPGQDAYDDPVRLSLTLTLCLVEPSSHHLDSMKRKPRLTIPKWVHIDGGTAHPSRPRERILK